MAPPMVRRRRTAARRRGTGGGVAVADRVPDRRPSPPARRRAISSSVSVPASRRPASKRGDRVLLPPLRDLLAGAVEVLVALGVALQPVGDALDERRAVAARARVDGLGDGVVDGLHVVAVDASRRGCRSRARASAMLSIANASSVDIDMPYLLFSQTKTTGSSHTAARLSRLVERALVAGAVAEEADDDACRRPAAAGPARRRRRSGCRRRRCRWRRGCRWRRRRCASSRRGPGSSRSPWPAARPSSG